VVEKASGNCWGDNVVNLPEKRGIDKRQKGEKNNRKRIKMNNIKKGKKRAKSWGGFLWIKVDLVKMKQQR
jgi:hypothetical protein